jgi:catechol-2,3-dioxygenase
VPRPSSAARGFAAGAMPSDIQGLHHTAYRCKDVEETRQFYEDFLGLPLVRQPAT